MRQHWASRGIDILGMATYIAYVFYSAPGTFTPILSVCHMLQILQIYRLTHRQVSLMMRTVHYQFGFLFSIVLFTIAIFLVLSRCIYLIEKEANPKINTIYDASWLVFVTIICIG